MSPLVERYNSRKVELARCPNTNMCVTLTMSYFYFLKSNVIYGACGIEGMDCDSFCFVLRSLVKGIVLQNCKVKLHLISL